MKALSVLGFLSAIAMTMVPAIYQGQRTFRWGEDAETAQLIERLESFPNEIDGWQTVANFEMQDSTEAMLSPLSYIHRRYQKDDRVAIVFVLLGPTGPTAVHTPDICFSSQHFEALGERVAVSAEPSALEKSKYWRIRFRGRGKSDVAPYISSWYAWTVDGTLHADPSPRYTFAEYRHLIKVQISMEYLSRDAMFDDREIDQFCAAVGKEIRLAVREPSASADSH